VLYSFSGGADGAFPRTDSVRDAAGNLYGTTSGGGSASGSFGNGVVFKLAPAGQETVLVTFTGGTDGALPYGGLVRDSAGNLYGTTSAGGAFQWGNIFKLDKTGKETVLYSFTGGTDGSCPMSRLSWIQPAISMAPPNSAGPPEQALCSNWFRDWLRLRWRGLKSRVTPRRTSDAIGRTYACRLFNRACSSEESERERAEERKQIEKDKLAITPQHCALAAVVERVSAPLKKLTCSLLFSS
jgi:uncharacterized repeat protein (TIGR03803 family)